MWLVAHLLHELEEAGFASQETILLLTIVDFDPAGDIIANSFMEQLHSLGFTSTFNRIDLMHPSRMTYGQIGLHKYRLPKAASYQSKIDAWIERTGGLGVYNSRWKKCGLEADSMTWSEFTAVFDQEVQPYLKVPREQIVRRRLKRKLVDVLKEVLLQRLLG